MKKKRETGNKKEKQVNKKTSTASSVLELEIFISHVDSPGKLRPVSLVVDLLNRNAVLLTPVTETLLG